MKLLASMEVDHGKLDCYIKDITIYVTFNYFTVWDLNLLEYKLDKYTFEELMSEGGKPKKVYEIQYIQQDILKTLINNNVIPVYVVLTEITLMSNITNIGVKILEERIKIYKLLGA